MSSAAPRRFTDSLVFRLIAFGVALVAVALIARVVLLTSVLQEGIGKIAGTEQMALATYVAHDIDGKIRARRQLLENIARDLPQHLLTQPQKLEAWLAERHAIMPLFNLGIAVVAPTGHGVIAEFPVLPGRHRLDFSSTDWLIAAREQGEFFIGKPVVGRATGDPLVVMAMPFKDAAGRVAAVIAGVTTLNAPGFLDLIENSAIGASGGFLLISCLLYTSPSPRD